MKPIFVLSTRNAHKAREIQNILSAQFDYLTLDDLPGAPKVSEDQPTFAGNAAKKAQELAAWIQEHRGDLRLRPGWILADDSGLEVDALGGAPGIHSARFASGPEAGNAPDAANNAKLLRLLAHTPLPDRSARFRCVLALAALPGGDATVWPRPAPAIFEGTCEGRIDFEPHGSEGFGYDPLFIPRGFDRSFAQLGEEEKNKISHRAQALQSLRQWLQESR